MCHWPRPPRASADMAFRRQESPRSGRERTGAGLPGPSEPGAEAQEAIPTAAGAGATSVDPPGVRGSVSRLPLCKPGRTAGTGGLRAGTPAAGAGGSPGHRGRQVAGWSSRAPRPRPSCPLLMTTLTQREAVGSPLLSLSALGPRKLPWAFAVVAVRCGPLSPPHPRAGPAHGSLSRTPWPVCHQAGHSLLRSALRSRPLPFPPAGSTAAGPAPSLPREPCPGPGGPVSANAPSPCPRGWRERDLTSPRRSASGLASPPCSLPPLPWLWGPALAWSLSAWVAATQPGPKPGRVRGRGTPPLTLGAPSHRLSGSHCAPMPSPGGGPGKGRSGSTPEARGPDPAGLPGTRGSWPCGGGTCGVWGVSW